MNLRRDVITTYVKSEARDYLRAMSSKIRKTSGNFVSPAAILRALLMAAMESNVDLADLSCEDAVQKRFRARMALQPNPVSISQVVQ